MCEIAHEVFLRQYYNAAHLMNILTHNAFYQVFSLPILIMFLSRMKFYSLHEKEGAYPRHRNV